MESIVPKGLIRENVNLLVTLHYLIKYKHVGKVAEKLYISQSAVSQQLNQLRDTFSDQLLVRVQNKMLPTQLAMKLDPLLLHALESIGNVYDVKHKEIKPSKSNYNICIIDCIITESVSKFFFTLSQSHIGTSFQITDRYHGCTHDFLRGDIDFLVGSYDGLPSHIHHAPLITITYSAYVGKDHPLLESKQPVSMEALNKYQLIELETHKNANYALNRKGLVAASLKLPKFETVCSILKESTAVCFFTR